MAAEEPSGMTQAKSIGWVPVNSEGGVTTRSVVNEVSVRPRSESTRETCIG